MKRNNRFVAKIKNVGKRIPIIMLALLMVVMSFTACSSTGSYTSGGVVRISIDEWIGYKSLLDANGGLTTAPGSIFDKLGLNVEFVIMNDYTASSTSLISGDLAGAGYTVNRYAFLQSKFNNAGVEVVMPFITNYSNGGDGIIANSDIATIKDLVGKKIAVPEFSEAQTLVEWLITHSNLSDEQINNIRSNMTYFNSAEETGQAFFAGEVDAAATWEPYLTMAASSTDSRILFDTSDGTNLILSGIIFRKDFLAENEDFMVKFIEGVLEASVMYKTNFDYVKDMTLFQTMEDSDIIDMANGADLATWGQNMKLLTSDAVSMYEDMANIWIQVGEQAFPNHASEAFTSEYMEKLKSKYEGTDMASTDKKFDDDKTVIIESPEALLEYSADIQFELNSYEISVESYPELDEFVKVAKVLDGAYIQIEGNASLRATGITDAQIEEFSLERANSVANYFIAKGIKKERIVTIGNGDSKPADPENPSGAVNRRTEFLFKTQVGY